MTLRRFLLFLLIGAVALLGFMYWTATRDPIVREARVALPGWPKGERPVRTVLISDIHVAGPDMPPERLAGIMERINGLHPDLVLIAGDFVGDKDFGTRIYPLAEIVRPLRALRPRLGTIAVLGNHDHWRNAGETRQALRDAGVIVLDNNAAQAGPLAIGGLGDAFTAHDDLPATLQAMRRLQGARLLLSHDPDPFPELPDDVRLMFAGHTHCGQIRLPLLGALMTESDYGQRYACRRIDENGRSLFVTAGLGTSIVPLRLGAFPDLWLITLGPEKRPLAGR